MQSVSEKERAKYTSVWQIDAYGDNSPGEARVDLFWRMANPRSGQSVLDIGAGNGAASRALKARGLLTEAFDLTNEAWTHVDIPLSTGSIWHGLGEVTFDYGYCCDVMEHIPTEFVALSIDRILRTCRRAFFSVSFNGDHFGRYVGEPLHLTVKPFRWWLGVFRELGDVLDARDLIGDGVFYVSR